MIQYGLERITPDSNERTRCEGIVGQLMIEIAIATEMSLFPGYPLEVNPQLGLVGECDYLLSRSPLTFRIHPPIALIVEVKRTLDRALPHCLLEMIAAQQLNASSAAIYGVLTTGLQWQFLKLEGDIATVDQNLYDLHPIQQIAAILMTMLE